MVVWGAFLAPFARNQQPFAGKSDIPGFLKDLMDLGTMRGVVKFLRGEVLTTIRRPPFAVSDPVSLLAHPSS